MDRRFEVFAMFILPMMAFGSGWAADDVSPTVVTLDTFVITATRTETPLLESPVAVSLTTRQTIERRPAASVADLLRDLPGIMIADNSLPGMQRLRIRGEEARRSLVLVDGHEISDHSSFGPPLLIDPAFIERVEVVRGPHSTLYGSRAAGGVINVITRGDESSSLSGSAGMSVTGATGGYRAHFGLSGRSGEFDYRVGASRSNDGDRRTPSGLLPDTETSSTGFMGRMGWNRENHGFALLYDRHELESEASTPEGLVDGFVITDYQMNMPRRDREKIGLVYDGHDLSPVLKNLHADVFWQAVDRNITQSIAGTEMPPAIPPVHYDYFNNDFDTIDTIGANVQADWAPSEQHHFVVGASWLRDQLDKTIHRTGERSWGTVVQPAELMSVVDAGITTTAVFVQDTWAPAPRWRVVAGARQYFVSSALDQSNDPLMPPRTSRDSHVIGNVAIVYLPAEGVALRTSWGQGYVYPTLLHQHTGSLFGQGSLTRPNPTLKPETSRNWEAGLRYENQSFSLDVAIFAATADGYIASVSAASLPQLGWAATERTYSNLDRARSQGIEVATSARFGPSETEVYAQGTYLRREVEYVRFTTTENGQPRLSGRIGVRSDGRFTPTIRWHVDAYAAAGGRSALRTSRSRREADAWMTFNLAAGVRFQGERAWWVGLEANNIFDEEYRPATDELVQPGRHLSGSVRVEF